jgi:hypothetical protein
MKTLTRICIVGLVAAITGCGQKAADQGLDKESLKAYREMLFADQSVDSFLGKVDPASVQDSTNTVSLLVAARDAISTGSARTAKEKLRAVLQQNNPESRVNLLTWAALRTLGEQPDSKAATVVHGVVMDIPVGKGMDTLAAYADGTARYINYSGKVIIFEIEDARVQELCSRLMSAAQAVADGAPLISERTDAAREKATIHLLTCEGIRRVEATVKALSKGSDRFAPVYAGGTELMNELVHRATKKK